MKYVRGVLVWCVVSGVAWGSPADFSAPVVAKQFQPVKKSAAVVSNKSSPSVPRNVIPITTLNSNESNETGVPRHEPCAAIRLTPTLLLTAAHCLVGGLTHGSRVYAGLFKAQDDTQGLLFSDSRKANLFQPNAQVFLYRPHWNENHPAATPLDFAVVVLDRKLKFNSKFTQKITNLLGSSDDEIAGSVIRDAQSDFAKQSAAYTRFINKPLDTVALLTMSPDVVVDELQGRRLSAYFWNGYPYEPTRDPVRILSQTGIGTAPDSSHLLLFRGEEFHPGTSGSPVFDTQRKVVVSVASGVIADGSNGGGLIDKSLCQWVKSHDRAVKCLVRHGNDNQQESPETSAWGR